MFVLGCRTQGEVGSSIIYYTGLAMCASITNQDDFMVSYYFNIAKQKARFAVMHKLVKPYTKK